MMLSTAAHIHRYNIHEQFCTVLRLIIIWIEFFLRVDWLEILAMHLYCCLLKFVMDVVSERSVYKPWFVSLVNDFTLGVTLRFVVVCVYVMRS